MDSVCTHTMELLEKVLFYGSRKYTHKFYELLASNEEHYEKQKIAQEKKSKSLKSLLQKQSKSCNCNFSPIKSKNPRKNGSYG